MELFGLYKGEWRPYSNKDWYYFVDEDDYLRGEIQAAEYFEQYGDFVEVDHGT